MTASSSEFPIDRRFWDVKVWWTDKTRGRWESSCHVSIEYAPTAHKALEVCIEWRKIHAVLDGFRVDLVNPDNR